MILTVASGKGGTGKTTVATSLALAIADLSPLFLDCDVEAPNAHIFLNPEITQSQIVNLPIPAVDESRCEGCGRCAEVCQYHAIVLIGGKVLVFPELCHGCGSCTLQCPEGAIEEIPNKLGLLEAGVAKNEIRFARGTLDIGQPMAVPIIRTLQAWNPFGELEPVIRDAPPGVSCPVVETMSGADFVLLVTEPTPFGLHDLQLAVQLTGELGLPVGVVLNREGIGDQRVDEYCQTAGIPILMRIPYDERIGRAVADGKPLVEAFPDYLPRFRELFSCITDILDEQKSMNHHVEEIVPISKGSENSGR
jgi:MinD superfamily P-loop ATPase